MYVPNFDFAYLLCTLPAFAVGIIATILLRYWSNKYIKIPNVNRITGIDVVEKIARSNNIDVQLEVSQGFMTDHYNPRTKILSLSKDVAQVPSIASVSIAAHEMGHAQQHKAGSFLLSARTVLVPAVNIGSYLGYFLLILGIIIGFSQLAWLGIILFSGTTLFTFFTLPIEFDASRRAIEMLQKEQILFSDEMIGAKQVLMGAALTYVAATLQSLGNLVYFIFRVQGISKRK